MAVAVRSGDIRDALSEARLSPVTATVRLAGHKRCPILHRVYRQRFFFSRGLRRGRRRGWRWCGLPPRPCHTSHKKAKKYGGKPSIRDHFPPTWRPVLGSLRGQGTGAGLLLLHAIRAGGSRAVRVVAQGSPINVVDRTRVAARRPLDGGGMPNIPRRRRSRPGVHSNSGRGREGVDGGKSLVVRRPGGGWGLGVWVVMGRFELTN